MCVCVRDRESVCVCVVCERDGGNGFDSVAAHLNNFDAAFVLLLGDNNYDSGLQEEFDARMDPALAPARSGANGYVYVCMPVCKCVCLYVLPQSKA